MIFSTPSLLIAGPQLQDPNFWHSVVLLLEQNDDGAVGFILNRPADVPLSAILKDEQFDLPESLPAWFAGPVGTDNGLILSNQSHSDHFDGQTRAEGLSISSTKEAMQGLADYAHRSIEDFEQAQEHYQSLYPYRFLVGYAGWDVSQLDAEIREGWWLQLPLDLSLIFNTPWNHMWDEAIAGLGVAASEFAPTHQDYLN